MLTTVTVAPREIHDLAYRASRIAGCDAGNAERIARNVTFAEIHHRSALSAFCEALRTVDLPESAWVTAPDALLAAEVAAHAAGRASATFDPGAPLAAIAGTLWQSLGRGITAVGIDGRARGDTTVRVVELHEIGDDAAAASRARIADADAEAHRLGISIDRIWFDKLEDSAAGFLVAETTLDLID